MARRAVIKRDGFPEIVEEYDSTDDVGFAAEVEQETPSYVKVFCNREGIVKVFGPVTGALYEFHSGGPVMVDRRDLSVFENANRNVIRSCCGSLGSPKFLIEEV